jgi:hypothetical protein
MHEASAKFTIGEVRDLLSECRVVKRLTKDEALELARHQKGDDMLKTMTSAYRTYGDDGVVAVVVASNAGSGFAVQMMPKATYDKLFGGE